MGVCVCFFLKTVTIPKEFCTQLRVVLTKPTIVRIYLIAILGFLKWSCECVLCKRNKQRHCNDKKRNACRSVATLFEIKSQ